MNYSSPEASKPPSPKSFLFIGPPGGGKTSLAMQMPGVVFMDCDGNLDGPERMLRERKLFKGYGYESIRLKDDGKTPVPVEEAFDRLMDKLMDVRSMVEAKTVVVDGLTHVNEFVVRKTLAMQNKPKNPLEMELRDWIPFKSRVYQLLVGRLQGLGKITVCTCHEKIITETDKGGKETVIGYQPAFQGGVTDYFGGFFSDMIRCCSKRGLRDQMEYWIYPNSTNQSDLKNSLGIKADINVTDGAGEFLKYLPTI